MPELKRVLGLGDALAIVIGIVIGSGIFRTSTEVAKHLHASGPILLAWSLGGLTALAGSLTYAELAAAWPRTGGMYVYLRECFGSLTSFLYGWSQLLVVRPAGVAGIAVIFAEYVGYFLPLSQRGIQFTAIIVIVAVSIINYVGVVLTSWIQNIFTSLKVVALLGLVALGYFFANGSGVGPLLPSTWESNFWTGFGTSLILIYWTYDGWNELTFISGEIRDAHRTIPRALWIGTISILLLYLLVNFTYMHVLTVEGVAGSERVATDTMVRLVGPMGGAIIAWVVLVSTFSSLNGTTLTGSRIFFAMAIDGNFFSWARKIDPRFRTPSTAIALQALLAIPLVLAWKFEQLATYYVFVSLVFHGLTTAAVFVLRRKPELSGYGYRTWGYPWTPLLFIVMAGWMLVITYIESPAQAIVGSGIILSGIPVYFFWQKVRSKN